MKHLLLFVLALSISTLNSYGQGEQLLIEQIQVVDVQSGKTKTASVLIKNGKISAIKKKITTPDNCKIIDGSGKWLIPGLVDAHIHLFQSGGVYTRPDALDLTANKPYLEEVAWVRKAAGSLLKRYLRCGITTVMDLGGPMTNFDIRKEYSDNRAYPNLLLTGPLLSPYQPDAFDLIDAPIVAVHNTAEAVSEARKQFPLKPDFMKIWYLDAKAFPADSSFAWVKATIEESHAKGYKVAVHATQLKTAKLALKAGANFLVHSVDDEIIDEEFIKLMLENKATYIPTLLVYRNYIETFTETQQFSVADFNIAHPSPLGSYFDLKTINSEQLDYIQNSEVVLERFKQNLHNTDSICAYNLALLVKRGVNVATGTDAGNIGTFHASSYYDELDAMSKFGLSNTEILKASTINGAKVLNKEKEFGSIEIGKMADLVILEENPIEDLNALKKIVYVIKNGQAHAVDSILSPSPEELVQQQVNGYNARNIDAFLAPYSDSLEIYMFPNTLQQEGKENIKENYIQLFKNAPNLHCEIISRTIHGNTVIDKERVRGILDGKILEAVAIYEIENGKIARVYFLKSMLVDAE